MYISLDAFQLLTYFFAGLQNKMQDLIYNLTVDPCLGSHLIHNQFNITWKSCAL